MAEGKLHYNERFSFSDPSCRLASSRSTRCRYKRLRQHQELIIDDEDRDLQLLEGQNQANPHNPTVNIIRKETTLTPLKSHCCDGELDDETMPQAEDIDTIDHSYEDVSELLAYRDSPNDNDDEETEESSSEQELFMSQLAMDELSNPEGEEEESNTSMAGEGSHQSRRGTLIYDGSSLTAEGSLALLMQYKVRHNITYKALGDLLKLLKLHCPIPNYIPATVYQFKKHFSQLGYSTVMHLYCSYCLGNVDTPELKNCINPHCKADLSSSGSISSFIEVPLDAQLKTFFKRESFVNALQKRFSERKGSSSKYSDIYDGEVYQGMYNNGFLQEVNNISLILNCDGIPVFRSSGYSFWPQFLLINELPYKMRLSKEYRLFAGIWYGCSKPDMNLFLKPLMDSLKNLYTSGVTVTVVTSDGDMRTVVCRAALICGTFDLPARAAVLNMVQFNGYWGCSKCLQKGTRVKTTSSGHGSTHVYPYKDTNPYGPVRTHKQFITDSQNAFKKGSNEYGIKGPTALALLPSFNLVKGIAVDYMHCILLGVCRLLLRLWLNTEHHQSLWYIGGKTEEMDELLFKIKPPDEIKRVPRSFQTVKYWKAHELRAWLLHYSPVVLHDFLHEIYYQHHLLLVESTFLLLQDTVSETDIEQSERLLQHYCFLFGNIYGERYMTMNVHNLLHLPSVVRQLGLLKNTTKVPGHAKEKTVGLTVTAESRLDDEDNEDVYSLSSTDEDLNPEEIEPIFIPKEKSLNKNCLAERTDSLKDDSYMKYTKPPTKLKLFKHEGVRDHNQGISYCYTPPGHTPPSGIDKKRAQDHYQGTSYCHTPPDHTPPSGVGRKVELVDGYGVFISTRQLDEAIAASGNSPLKLIRNFMSTFFDVATLANSSCYGTRQHKGLNRDVTAACIKYVQSKHPEVSRSALVDAINDKCANARRKRKGTS